MALLRLLLMLTLWTTSVLAEEDTYSSNVCTRNTFRSACPTDQIADIIEARVGRMTDEFCDLSGIYIGCHADVTYRVRYLCTNTPNCTFEYKSTELNTSNCPEGLLQYLTLSYRCSHRQTSYWVSSSSGVHRGHHKVTALGAFVTMTLSSMAMLGMS